MFDPVIKEDAGSAVSRSAGRHSGDRYERCWRMRSVTGRRSQLLRITLIGLGIALGLGSRHSAEHLPGFVAAYAGDTLWAFVAFLSIGLLLPRTSTWAVAVLAMSFSVLIEISQLYHAPWIDSIRHTTLGGLVLGYGFLWSDLVCYAVGVALSVVIEAIWIVMPRTSADIPRG
jgi:hypothetical protein